MTRTPLNLTTPRFIENPRSFQLSARSFVTKHQDFLQKADVCVCVCMCCFFFFNWSYWHYLLLCAKIIGMEIFLLPLLGCQSRCNWKTRFPALRSHVWGIGAQKDLSSLHALYGSFSLFFFSFSRTQHQEFSESRTEANVPLPTESFFTGKNRASLNSESITMRRVLFLLLPSALHPYTQYAQQKFENELMHVKIINCQKCKDFLLFSALCVLCPLS